jgi:hypothetical protein
MSWRRRNAIGGLVVLCLAAGRPAAAQFAQNVVSQNCLHLGWGGGTAAKAAGIGLAAAQAQGVGAAADLIVLQEVMPNGGAAGTALVVAQMPLGAYNIGYSAPAGVGSYLEMYAFVANAPALMGPIIVNPPGAPAGFSRPPAGTNITTGAGNYWLFDYHAVFGKRIAIRRTEVALVPALVAAFQATLPAALSLVIGGDWNLPTNDGAFAGFGAYGLGPNVLTSLTRNGGLSSAYDHFAWQFPTAPINIVTLPPLMTNQAWRTTVSDHLGITCQLQ